MARELVAGHVVDEQEDGAEFLAAAGTASPSRSQGTPLRVTAPAVTSISARGMESSAASATGRA